jgi:hypothetical protein
MPKLRTNAAFSKTCGGGGAPDGSLAGAYVALFTRRCEFVKLIAGASPLSAMMSILPELYEPWLVVAHAHPRMNA